MIEVVLCTDELYVAAMSGIHRRIVRLATPDRNYYDDAHQEWTTSIEGAAGEYVVAKVLDRYPSGLVFGGSYVVADVGDRIHVRTRTKDHYDLIVRDRDPDDEPFVLVTGHAPRYTVRGWIYGRDAKREDWRQTYGGGVPAYFVPQSALRPLPDRRNASAKGGVGPSPPTRATPAGSASARNIPEKS